MTSPWRSNSQSSMPFMELPADKANELLHVKVVAPTMLARAVPGMVARGEGTIINVSGMLVFSGSAPTKKLPVRRAVYTGTLAHIVALSQALHEELKSQGLQVQALCPGSRRSFTNAKGSISARCPHVGGRDRQPAASRAWGGDLRPRRREDRFARRDIQCRPGGFRRAGAPARGALPHAVRQSLSFRGKFFVPAGAARFQ